MVVHQILILVPLVAAVLDIADLLSTLLGRLLVLAVLVVGLIVSLRNWGLKSGRQLMRSSVISCAAAVLTFLLSTKLGLGAVVASALVGLIGAQLLNEREQLVMYLGAFVGMSSALRFPALTPIVLAGLWEDFCLSFLRNAGWGWAAGWAPLLLLGGSGPISVRRDLMPTLLLNIIIALCGVLLVWLRQNTKLSVVEVSALLALTAGLVLPHWLVKGHCSP